MVIEENENANYLAHYKTKGAKNGIRRYQSYLVQPNPSGATGQEVGEAAEQRQRITGHDEREEGGDRNASMQRLQERVAPRKKTTAEILQDRKKKKWAKSYRSLYKHADSFSNKELNDAITRLDLKDRIRNKHLSSLARNTQDGSNALRNIAQGSASMLSIYNALALGVNAYNTYAGNKDKKQLPTINTSFIGLGGGGGNKDKKKDDKNAKHDALLGPYIEHFGIPGQKWFKRHFQSYKTAPTRSGKVGEEIGLAAKQAERLGEEKNSSTDFISNVIKNSDGSFSCKLPKDSDMSFESNGSERAKSFYDKYDAHRKNIIKSIADNYEKEYARYNLKTPLTQAQAFDNSIAMGLAWRKCKDSLEKSGMSVTIPSEKGWPLQVIMDGGDIYGGHMLTFEYDDRKKKITKTGIAVEG